MGISELEPQDAPPELVGCPICRRADKAQPVSAAVGKGWRLPTVAPAAKYEWAPLLALLGAGGLVHTAPELLHETDTPTVFQFVVCGWLMLLTARKTVAVFKRRKRIRLGESDAGAVWNEGWLCARCEVIYFQPGYEPRGVGLHQPLQYEEFQLEVYRAGGYEDLADKGED